MDIKVTSQGGQANLPKVSQSEGIKAIHNKEVKIESIKDNYKKEDLDKAITKLNSFLNYENTSAVYSFHEKFGDIMVKIVDNETKKVLMEYPPQKILDLVAKMCELVGIGIDKKA